jgi:hypothetical protein
MGLERDGTVPTATVVAGDPGGGRLGGPWASHPPVGPRPHAFRLPPVLLNRQLSSWTRVVRYLYNH